MKKTSYFHNKNQFEDIEPDTLWKLEGSYMILVDDDQHISIYYQNHEDWFYEVETPEELK